MSTTAIRAGSLASSTKSKYTQTVRARTLSEDLGVTEHGMTEIIRLGLLKAYKARDSRTSPWLVEPEDANEFAQRVLAHRASQGGA